MQQTRRGWLLTLAAICVLTSTSCGRNRPHPLAKSAKLEVYAVAAVGTAGTRTVVDPETGTPISLALSPIITSADVATVARSEESPKNPSFIVKLTPLGGKKFAAATTPATGQQVVILVNGIVAGAPKVRSTISDSFAISGGTISKDREQIIAALTEE